MVTKYDKNGLSTLDRKVLREALKNPHEIGLDDWKYQPKLKAIFKKALEGKKFTPTEKKSFKKWSNLD